MLVVRGLILVFCLSLKISLSQILSYTYYDVNSNADGALFPDPCQTDRGYAVGIYNSSGTIHINRGIQCTTDSYITYDPITNTFPSSTGCDASCPAINAPVPQYFTQIGDIMYITSGRRFLYYDLNKPLTPYDNYRDSGGSNLNFPTRMESDTMCIAVTSDQRYLIGIGGLEFNSGAAMTNIQILDLLNEVWIDETSIYLPSTRWGCGAIVHPYNNNLYVTGGWGSTSVNDYKNTLWSLYTGDMTNISAQSWNKYTRAVLATDHFGRLIANDVYLIILGGYSNDTASIIIYDISGASPTFFTETIAINGMEWGNAGITTIGNRIYVFGIGEVLPYSQWQWIDLNLTTDPSPSTGPTPGPSPGPTPGPSPGPTAAPSPVPTASTSTPSSAPIMHPTMSPTTAPTVIPTPLGPTPSPTKSNNEIYIDKNGCDCYLYCHNQTFPCLTINFAYNCFLGNNNCGSTKGYDGNGIINLGDGDWYWPFDLIYDDEEVIITGNGMENTKLYYNDSSYIGCKWHKCWLEINNLTLASNTTNNNNDATQIYMQQGGTLIFKNILFDGNNYNINKNGNPFWTIKDDKVTVIFKQCIFRNNNNVFYEILNGASVQFNDCIFADNQFTQSPDGVFVVIAAYLSLNDCDFRNNIQNGKQLINIQNDGQLIVANSLFVNNNANALVNISGSKSFNTFNCSTANSLVTFISNSFVNNAVNSLFNVVSSSIYLSNNIYDENVCNDFCIKSTDTAISINMESLNTPKFVSDYNFIQVNHISSKSSLCINGSNNIEISKYLSFNNNTDITNTKVNFTHCIEPFSMQLPNISPPIELPQQLFLNNIAGGSVLETFQCYDYTSTCSIICDNSVSCFSSTFLVNTPTANIACSSNFACGYGTINATHYNTSNSVHIVCNDSTSCLSTTINVNSVNQFTLDCIASDACKDMTVNIVDTIDSSINCHHVEACDSITIITDDDNTTLTLHEFSSNILFDTPSGYTGYNLICNPNNAYIVLDQQFNSLKNSVNDIYPNLPCNDTHFQCNKTKSCSISYIDQTSNIDVSNFEKFFNCYGPIELEQLYKVRCLGTCPESPTISPTNAPSFSPTALTKSPLAAPTTSPTLSPTTAPSMPPTISPSNSPTNSPSVFPTYSPSEAPINSPTVSPTVSPTDNPTSKPSKAPTFSPSNNPTSSPTLSPTDSPSPNPTFSPSVSPSHAPTNSPIASDDFDSFILITYILDELDLEDKINIVNNPINETLYIESVIKSEYFIENIISYQKYLVDIVDIEGTKINEIDRNTEIQWTNLKTLKLNTKIECDVDDNNVNYCESIKQQSQPNNDFADRVQEMLRNHTLNFELLFNVNNAESLSIQCKYCEIDENVIDYVLYGLLSLVGFMFILSIFSFLFNKGKFPKFPGFNYVDDARWVSLIIFGIQFWDFYSDINLSVEIMTRDDLFDNLLILIAGSGSVFFVLLPYIANLFLASRIKDIIKGNAAAKGWFQYHTSVFTVLVVVSGGVHAALSLVSSGIFGLKIFHCGLTQYELRKLGRLKVIGTVLIENIPQLICQAMYSVALGGQLTSAVQLAFIASALSVIASTLSYLIEKDTADTKVVQYYLLTQCTLRKQRDGTDKFKYDDDDDDKKENIKTFTKKGEDLAGLEDHHYNDNDTEALSPSFDNTITDEERLNLINNRGKTQALGEHITEVFGIPTKNIEVGYSMITKYGIITHIVHYVYDIDIETMEEELNENTNNNQQIINVNGKYFVSQLFVSLERDINQIFRKHFGLNKDFEVTYQHRLGIKKRTLTHERSNSKRDIILKRMMTQIEIGRNTLNQNQFENEVDIELQAINVLTELFKRKGTVNDEEKLNLYLNLTQKMKMKMKMNIDIDHDGDMNELNETQIQNEKDEKMVLLNTDLRQKSVSVDVSDEDELERIEMTSFNAMKSTPL